jgi:hypothetical protein
MPTYKVKVKILAEFEFETTLDASSQQRAEELAVSRQSIAANTPDDFAVDSGYCSFDIDATRTRTDCPGCGCDHETGHDGGAMLSSDGRSILYDRNGYRIPDTDTWSEDDDYCARCGAQLDNEDFAKTDLGRSRAKAGVPHA